jgi:hypothetical protein
MAITPPLEILGHIKHEALNLKKRWPTPPNVLGGMGLFFSMIQNNEYKKSAGGNKSNEAEMRKALKEIIRLVEGWVDADVAKAADTMLKILNTALEVV